MLFGHFDFGQFVILGHFVILGISTYNPKKSLIDVPTCHRFFVHLGIVFHFIFIVVDANVWEENKSKIENNDNGIEVKSSPI